MVNNHNGQYTMIFPLIFVFVLMICNTETYDGPDNVVTFINGTETLGCQSAGNLDEVSWIFTEVGSGKEVHNQKLPTSKAARWSVNRTGRHSRLIITGIEPGDAGLFVCLAEAEQYAAQLVILASNPSCQMELKKQVLTMDRVHAVEENDILNLECRVVFWGNWQPTMRWELQGRVLELNTADSTVTKVNNSMTSTLKLVIKSTRFPHPFIRLTCTTYFAMEHRPTPTSGTKTAANCPGYNYTWHAPVLTIDLSRNYITDSKYLTEATQDTQEPSMLPSPHVISLVSCALTAVVVIALIIWKFIKMNAKNKKTERQQTGAPEYCDINEDEMQVDSEVVETIVEMEVSTAESHDEIDHNRIHPAASKEGRSSSEVDEISEEAEYRNIPGEDRTPEYENEARIENGEDDGLGSKTDVSTSGSAAPIKPPKNINYIVLDASTRDNPGPPSIYKRLKSKPFNPNSTKQPVTCVEADKSLFDSPDVECCSIESGGSN